MQEKHYLFVSSDFEITFVLFISSKKFLLKSLVFST
jgi:hypothetical protein